MEGERRIQTENGNNYIMGKMGRLEEASVGCLGIFPSPFFPLAIRRWDFVEHDSWTVCTMDLNGETKDRANNFPCLWI